MRIRFVLQVVGVLVLALVIAGCESDPKSVAITQDNEETFLEDIKDMKGLTIEESRMLHAYVIRAGMAEVFGGEAPKLAGQTIGDLIETQRLFEAEAKAQEEEQDRLAAEARAREEAIAAELRKTISFGVYDKSFQASDIMSGRYSDYVVIKCTYENTSEKNVRAFTGSLRFTDLFGKPIYESGLTISDPVAAGERGNWSGTIEYNQFMDEHKSLRNTKLEDMKVIWLPSEILFADGSTIGGS